jgi:hypothetical protein
MPTTLSHHGQTGGADAPAFTVTSAADREEPDSGDGPGKPRGRAQVPPPQRPQRGIYRALRDAIIRNMRDESDRPWE